jgi:small subunit ribosomal protein S17
MSQQATQAAKTAYRTFRELHGVVVSAGMMDKTVKVRVGGQKWNSFLKKVGLSLFLTPFLHCLCLAFPPDTMLTNPVPRPQFFDDPKTHLVHDPANSLRLGDVVAITPGWRVSKSKRHVVKHIIAPGSGVPIDGRTAIPTAEARHAEREAARKAKDDRRMVTKLAERAEAQMGVAEAVLRRVRKELAVKGRLGGLGRQTQQQAAGETVGQQ